MQRSVHNVFWVILALGIILVTGSCSNTVQEPLSMAEEISGAADTKCAESISGYTYFDVNGNDLFNEDEPAIPGLVITVSGGTGSIATTSNKKGRYFFGGLEPIQYTVTAGEHTGFMHWPPYSGSETIQVTAPAEGRNFAYNPDFLWLFYSANHDGYSPEYWKAAIGRAIGIESGESDPSPKTLKKYIKKFIDSFALDTYNSIDLEEAYDILAYAGSDSLLNLEKQVLTAEFNYAAGVRINDDDLLTRLFLHSGEYMVKHSGQFPDAELPDPFTGEVVLTDRIAQAAAFFSIFNIK